ncbi:MAG: glycosyltransferase [Bacteroidia bacterium]|nr:glycosyltransferase [Bacteroidia bacterium]
MKILVALSRFPFPTEKGDKLRAYHQLRGLSRKHEVHLICLNDKPPLAEHIQLLQGFCKSLEIIILPKWKVYLNVLMGFLNRIPFQVNYFRSTAMKKRISHLIHTQGIEVCYVQLIRLGLNLPFGEKVPFFLDYMDAFSRGMENRLDDLSGPMRLMTKVEANRLKGYESKISAHFEGFSIISQADAAIFPAAIQDEIHVIPNGVKEEFFVGLERETEAEFDLIFTGNMGYHPNIKAARFLVEKILPELEARGRKVKVVLAGTHPAPEVKALASDQVVVTGFVEDLRDYFQQSRLFVAPLFTGQGLQNKLLESMAMGMPAFTTSLANEALKAENGVEIVECETESEFAEKIIYYLDHPAKAEELGKKGSEFIRQNYNWEACNAQLEKALEACVRKKA